MYIQVIKDSEDRPDLIQFVESLSKYGVRISVETHSILDKNRHSPVEGSVSIAMPLREAFELQRELKKILANYKPSDDTAP